jgi:protein TonB
VTASFYILAIYMRHQTPSILLLLAILSAQLSAQDHLQALVKSGTKSNKIKEYYYVLKDNKTVRDGSYELYLNDYLIESGYYKNGQRDSVWQVFHRNGTVLSQKWYTQGKPTGVWHFYNGRGIEQWSYDFAAGKSTVELSLPPSSTAEVSYYQSDSGRWAQSHLDTPLLLLRGDAEWLSFLHRNLNYPDDAVNKNLMGEVIISIAVDEQGKITGYEIIKSAAPSLDTEALRVVKLYPYQFIPAEKDGKKMKAQFHEPIIFKLEQY